MEELLIKLFCKLFAQCPCNSNQTGLRLSIDNPKQTGEDTMKPELDHIAAYVAAAEFRLAATRAALEAGDLSRATVEAGGVLFELHSIVNACGIAKGLEIAKGGK